MFRRLTRFFVTPVTFAYSPLVPATTDKVYGEVPPLMLTITSSQGWSIGDSENETGRDEGWSTSVQLVEPGTNVSARPRVSTLSSLDGAGAVKLTAVDVASRVVGCISHGEADSRALRLVFVSEEVEQKVTKRDAREGTPPTRQTDLRCQLPVVSLLREGNSRA